MGEKMKEENSENKIPAWFYIVTLGVFLMLLGMLTTRVISMKRYPFRANTISQIKGLIRLDTQTSKFILRSGIPILDKTASEDDPFTSLQINWMAMYWRLVANINDSTPLEILKAQLPLLAIVKLKPIEISAPRKMPIPPQIEIQPQPSSQPENPPSNIIPQPVGEPVVFIYHTHTSESYIPDSGKDHLLNQKGDVVKVGKYLQKILEEKYSIKCEQSDTIHDQFPFRDSYKRSQVTVINYLKEHPKTKVVIDLHRDATPGLANACLINGVKCATIVIVAGSDKMGLPHPHWRENLDFDKKLNDAMNFYYPGLSNGIIVSDARYNQHLHTHALLVEFGDQNTTLAEAYHSVDLFAEILANVIAKDPSPGITTLETNQ